MAMSSRIKLFDRLGRDFVELFHMLALFGIGAATVWAAGWTFVEIFQKSHASIQDLLLLFIYLELGAMVGIYFNTNHMPVRFLIYIAITALTRHIVDLITLGDENVYKVAALGGTILTLSVSVLVIRFASHRYPSKTDDVT
jgi:protein PsiE